MTKTRLDFVSVTQGNTEKSDALVVWLHGLGADGHDFESLVPFLNLPHTSNIRFVFPHAPIRPISINQGMPMRAWFDLQDLNRLENNTLAGFEETHEQLIELIEENIATGIPSHKVLLVGFSQGGTMALLTGLHFKDRLAGIMGLSTFLPAKHDRVSIRQSKNTPIFIAHGTEDYVLPFSYGQMTAQELKEAGFKNLTWREYSMAHDVCQQEIQDITQWIQTVLADSSNQ